MSNTDKNHLEAKIARLRAERDAWMRVAHGLKCEHEELSREANQLGKMLVAAAYSRPNQTLRIDRPAIQLIGPDMIPRLRIWDDPGRDQLCLALAPEHGTDEHEHP